MKRLSPWYALLLLLLSSRALVTAQQTSSNSSVAVFPRLIHFAGSMAANGSSAKVTGATFSLYSEESGGTPLWIETQNVALDDHGRYEVLLGSTKPEGIPMELFTSGEARWLGIRVEGGAELPRVLLVSVPYAVKALDAEMLGGKPPAAFALASAQGGSQSTTVGSSKTAASEPGSTLPPTITGSGTADFLSRWTSASSLGSSLLYQGPNGNFGIGTTTPSAKFAVYLTNANATAIRGTSVATSGGVGVEGVTGTTTAFPANMAAVMGLNQSKFGVAGLFNTTSINSWILEGEYNGKQVFALDPTGRVIANSGLFTSVTGPAVTGYSTYNNCINTDACNFGYLGGSAGVMGVGGAGSAGLFNSQGSGLVLEGTNQSNTDVFTVSNTGFVHAGSLVVDGINNTDTNGVQAFAFGSAATGVYGEADSSGNKGLSGFSLDGIGVFGQSSNGLSAQFAGTSGGFCNFDNAGNMGCTGTKSAVVPLRDGREVALYAVESPENWFEDFGSGQLKAGAATVVLDPEFAQTVNSSVEYHVFVTPNEECRGLYVSGKTSSSFEIRELNGGTSNIAFDYRVVARRKGYERLRMQDLTKREAIARAATARRIERPQKNTSKVIR